MVVVEHKLKRRKGKNREGQTTVQYLVPVRSTGALESGTGTLPGGPTGSTLRVFTTVNPWSYSNRAKFKMKWQQQIASTKYSTWYLQSASQICTVQCTVHVPCTKVSAPTPNIMHHHDAHTNLEHS